MKTSVRILALAGAAILAGGVAMADPAATGTAASAATTIKVRAGDGAAVERITLGVGSAAIVELPVEARDVLVSNPAVADAVVRTPQRIFVLGQAAGQTNAFFFDGAGKQILNLDIRVVKDFAGLNADVTRAAPRSDLRVQSQGEGVVIAGQAEDPRDVIAARSLAVQATGDANKVSVEAGIAAPEQVLLKVRVAEMQRTVAKQLGVDLSAAFTTGGVPFDLETANPFSLFGNALSATQGTIGDVASNNVEGTIRAFERVGLIRTLAEPNLTAISGESARFLAGGEFPVPVSRDRDGNVTVEFKPFGVGLAFTPVVLSQGRISLRIATEVSELTSENALTLSGLTVPGLTVRRAETTVELPSGGSLVMAGLLQQSTGQVMDGLPGAKNLPVLGALFSSKDFRNRETELVVIVTPLLVDPVRERELVAPTDGFAPPSDADASFAMRLNAVYPQAAQSAEVRTLARDAGFIIQ